MQDYYALVHQILDFPLFRFGGSVLTVIGLLKLIGWFIAVLVIEKLLRKTLLVRILVRTQLQPSSQFAIARIFGYAFIAFGAYLGFQFAGIDMSSLALFAGALGVGIGFGLQNVISNFVSGLIILIERPIALGDRVDVGGVEGTVTQISLRSTRVITNDNITIIVPNSDFIANKVTNWSHGDPKVRFRLPVGVAYGTDPERLKTLLVKVAQQHPMVLKEPAPELRFVGFGDSSIDFQLLVWTRELAHRPGRLRSDLYYAIEAALRENKIEIPFPQRDLHIRSTVTNQPPSAQGNGLTI